MSIRQLSDAQLQGKRALIRVDYNVPLDEDGNVADDARIRATLPTLEYLRGREACLILMSHLGRPKGERVEKYSLRPVAQRLSRLLDLDVAFVEGTTTDEAREASEELKPGDVLLLENTRFDPRETANDPEMARELAALGDVFVNDAFGAAHRAHASTAGVAAFLEPAATGFLMEKELEHLGDLLEAPEPPFVVILGGAKVSGKIDLIENLLDRIDQLCIGGAMACTFLRAKGLETGRSLVEEDLIELAGELMERAGDTLMLPEDAVVAPDMENGSSSSIVGVEEVPEDQMLLDIGPRSAGKFKDIAADARTVLWNGPVGAFEHPPFGAGSRVVTQGLVEATGRGAKTVVGGGDTAAALASFGLTEKVTHVSTGGGAALEFLAGKELPGVAALTEVETT
ncbi:MAG: phosphoglycerate kinase [Gemmatimonadetes bacterium]|uniref:Phosphoglycerate kinase n=1 Tax=Candidatus Kutchimonas denitrificans TaxID=3056748 RepID=A0AAE4Z8X8_9BACT|nr:phosphoglycerate kinase [Gemmatimonadota bacterium]NIR75193.1 phosphoglycerate kinase [Candidatus Kutchimonas denitrificans]NIS00131.1 phosphoglycerate kinase [Gemmatimonadota bacterium]NIT65723.1 phosphoglycerate kinase [Gemmatimonadota bacterium]NIU53001.1 phosphoglycerate kinase [Gemmatimonadota bacterium]